MREKLIELLNASFEAQYSKRGLLTAPHTADDLIANGVTVTDNNVGSKWMPANKPPKDNTENQWVIYKVGGSYFYATGYYDGKNWRSAITDFKIEVAGWMPLPEPPKGE